MKETARALQAWNDYLEMGDGRSIEKLWERYQSVTDSPTKRLPTIKDWSRLFGWQQRLAEIAEQEQAAIIARGIADRQNRVNALNDRWEKMQQVIAERATDHRMENVSGGKTGLLVAEPMLIKVYTCDQEDAAECELAGDEPRLTPLKQSEIVYKFSVDTAMLKEMREIEKQAAQELGQWAEGADTLNLQFTRIYIRDGGD